MMISQGNKTTHELSANIMKKSLDKSREEGETAGEGKQDYKLIDDVFSTRKEKRPRNESREIRDEKENRTVLLGMHINVLKVYRVLRYL